MRLPAALPARRVQHTWADERAATQHYASADTTVATTNRHTSADTTATYAHARAGTVGHSLSVRRRPRFEETLRNGLDSVFGGGGGGADGSAGARALEAL